MSEALDPAKVVEAQKLLAQLQKHTEKLETLTGRIESVCEVFISIWIA